MSRRRRAARFGALAALAALVGLVLPLVLPAQPAAAHAVLLSVSPENDAVLPESPGEVVLRFNEAVTVSAGKITAIDPDGDRLKLPKATTRAGGTQIVVGLPSGLGQGTHLVSYRIVSADQHPISGTVAFSIGRRSADAPKDPTAAAGGTAFVSTLLGGARYLGYGGLVLLVGSALVLLALWPRRLPVDLPAKLLTIGWSAIAAGAVAAFVLQAPYIAGRGLTEAGDWGAELGEVFGSRWGQAHAIRLAVLIAAIPSLRRLVLDRALAVPDRFVLGLLAVVGVLTWPLSGHPGASPVPLLMVSSDGMHLVSMSVWVGGLVVLGIALLPRARGRELGAIMPVWSRWAMWAVATLVLTGTVQTLLEVGGLDGLVGSTYGRLLLVKIIVLAGIVGLAMAARAAVRRRYVLPVAHAWPGRPGPPDTANDTDAGSARAAASGDDDEPEHVHDEHCDHDHDHSDDDDDDPDDDHFDPVEDRRTARRLRRLVSAEAVLAAIVIGVTSALVQTPQGRTATAEAAAPPPRDGITASIETEKVLFNLDISPAGTGPNVVHVFTYDRDNNPQKVLEWKATVSLPEKNIEPVEIPLTVVDEYYRNHVSGQVVLPVTGKWKIKITARISELDAPSVSRDFEVR